jgi:hypothetical protein
MLPATRQLQSLQLGSRYSEYVVNISSRGWWYQPQSAASGHAAIFIEEDVLKKVAAANMFGT